MLGVDRKFKRDWYNIVLFQALASNTIGVSNRIVMVDKIHEVY